MPDLSKIYLYRMTHIDNVAHILQHGITHMNSTNKNPDYKPIGDGSLISRRTIFRLPNGKKLSDYIPFYFGPRMPMLYVIQNGYNGVKSISPQFIVYCITTVATIKECVSDIIFTDGHAIDGLSEFYSADRLDDMDKIIDKEAIKTKNWKKDENDLDVKRRME